MTITCRLPAAVHAHNYTGREILFGANWGHLDLFLIKAYNLLL